MAELDRDPELIASLTSSDLAAPLTACSGHAVIVALGNRAAILAADRP
jgi:hypothetical protein